MHGIGRNAVNENLGYTTPMQVYNNTIVMGASGSQVAFWVNGMSTAPAASKPITTSTPEARTDRATGAS